MSKPAPPAPLASMTNTSIDALRTRLSVCRQQLQANSVFNTPKRKEALAEEIKVIEAQLAQALGLEDSQDEADSDSTNVKDEAKSTGPSTPDSQSSATQNITSVKRMRIDDSTSTPPNGHSFTTESAPFRTSISEASGSKPMSAVGAEEESVLAALADAGESVDIETLLQEQAAMEKRLADLKRRREESDELYAKMVQDDELRSWNSTSKSNSSSNGSGMKDKHASSTYSNASNVPSSSTSASSSNMKAPSVKSDELSGGTKSDLQSRLDKARQERMDEEMARLFEEADANVFNLTGSPKKIPNPSHQGRVVPGQPSFTMNNNSQGSSSAHTLPSYSTPLTPSYPIFSQQSGTTRQHPNIVADFRTFPQTRPPTQASQSSSQPSSSTNPVNSSLQQAVTSIIQQGLEAAKRTKDMAIDLTKPMIDLTKKVIELDDDPEPGLDEYSNSVDFYSYGSYDSYSDEYDSDGNRYGYDSDSGSAAARWLYDYYDNHYRKPGRHFGSSYYTASPSTSSRVLTQAESEKELRELLANIQATVEEIPPKDRTGTPEGMADDIVLLEHQKIGLTWLQKMEDGTNKGGILGDDMGLGKTIQTMALIVSRPSDPITDDINKDYTKSIIALPAVKDRMKTKATLVVAPVGLVYQWAEELRTKTQPGLLKVLVYYGPSRPKNPEVFRRYDVIITSFNLLGSECGEHKPTRAPREIGPLFKTKFHRVILDEAQVIKNKDAKVSIACSSLAADYRWCLSGTPIQNNITELFSLIRFLNIKPYCEWDEFRNKIVNPMKREGTYTVAIQRVQAVMKAICLRRTKTCKVDGKPILQLPDRNVEKVFIPFTDDERGFYAALENRTRERFNAYVRQGTVMKNYSNVLLLLLRLRQACCHPHLIKEADRVEEITEVANNQPSAKDRISKLLDSIVEAVRTRLLEHGLDAVECPICMDIGEESVILSKCGHIYCRDCISAHLERHEGDDRRCPECRGVTAMEQLVPVSAFNERFKPKPVVDPKGKGVATDGEGDNLNEVAPLIEVPKVLDTWISSSKIDRMVEVVQAAAAKNEKVIVFSQFTCLLDLIEKPLTDQRIPYLRYDGKMTAQAKNDTVQSMMHDSRYPVMLISLKCGSLGLNLTVANHVVMMDPWWNPAIENQAIDRVHRIGQKRAVHVHRLCIPDTVEDRILLLQQKKQSLADSALGEGGEVPKLAKLGLQDLMFLFRGN
ncbi:hypothetical protein BGZ94_007886 [Podila epigama]|nr:hypothetical protein BGZ94_007886 [Podila epigama]